ncbi:hypothetical protein JTE90_001323 [Oedothorax gibbosus]|uniref:Uncharacterized protein n=1 Tax=Oedothorax gibbosus TaxID=931172 RepID=A0AAV6U1E0_9ARAC|nr:hypothetical protein JTE90_001323 [Oedothorax gibbosus]
MERSKQEEVHNRRRETEGVGTTLYDHLLRKSGERKKNLPSRGTDAQSYLMGRGCEGVATHIPRGQSMIYC